MNIIDLIQKLQKGSISSDEYSELYKILEINNTHLSELFNEEWNKSSDKEIDPEITRMLYNKIEGKLKLPSDVKKDRFPERFKTVLFITLKYAAILIIGFVVAWVLMSYERKSLVVMSIAEDTYHIVKVDNGSKSTIQLPDGSVVYLNSGSQIKYQSGFGINNRNIFLEGEGFFDVAKNTELPFFVKTTQIVVKAVGTSFNVKSYPEDDITETTLVSGEIEIYQSKPDGFPDRKSATLAVLHPNEVAFISKNKAETIKTENNTKLPVIHQVLKPKISIEKEIKPEMYTEWKNEILVFNNEKFIEIIKKLERWYDIDVSLQYRSISSVRFSGRFDRESIEEVMDALQLIEPFGYVKDKNKLIIYKENAIN